MICFSMVSVMRLSFFFIFSFFFFVPISFISPPHISRWWCRVDDGVKKSWRRESHFALLLMKMSITILAIYCSSYQAYIFVLVLLLLPVSGVGEVMQMEISLSLFSFHFAIFLLSCDVISVSRTWCDRMCRCCLSHENCVQKSSSLIDSELISRLALFLLSLVPSGQAQVRPPLPLGRHKWRQAPFSEAHALLICGQSLGMVTTS